jgi:uncharacterized membrane protein YeaQ/YmgE (transglycosylase-associated protein family)
MTPIEPSGPASQRRKSGASDAPYPSVCFGLRRGGNDASDGRRDPAPADCRTDSDMAIGSVISAIIIGLVIGALGRLVLPGRQRIGILLTVAVGIIAALAGTALARAIGVSDTGGVDWLELLLQVLIAAVGVGLVAAVVGGGRRRRRTARR